jgi:RNA polymerase sigma factor (sigma-70 family)
MLTMATTALGTLLHSLRRSSLCQDKAILTDDELLESFIARRDGAAFEALVRQHGPMVLGVCRRVLRNEADAEDAFQATFLVLVRKAASIRPRAMVGNWLYGVAQSTALKARAMSVKRLAKEREAVAWTEPKDAAETRERLHALLDQELKTLPDRYRAAIVLCDLEGKSIKEAARQLGCPPGTVGTRLARGRSLLARRLSRHGPVLSSAGIAAAVPQNARGASVPPMLMSSTVKAALPFAGSPAAAADAVPAQVLSLTDGVLTSMLLTKLKVATGYCLAVCLLVAGAGFSSYTALAAKRPRPAALTESNAGRAEAPQAPGGKPPDTGQAQRPPADKGVRGSGKVITKEFQLADFTSIEVSRNFQVELARADSFRVAITTDENLMPHIQALKDGSTLRLSVEPNLSFWATSLKATVALPALEELRAASASRVTMKGFKSDKPFQANVRFVSTLEGDIEAPNVSVDVAGHSRVTLKGRAKEVTISASQGGRLSLADFAADHVDVTLKHGATATVNVKERLNYDLSQGCRLEYLGNPPTTKGKTTDASMAVPVTSTSALTEPSPKHGDAPHAHHRSGSAPVAIGAKVPDFALRDLNGRPVKFSELQKDVQRMPKGIVVLSFWCSTCGSCRRVEHHLDKLAKDYQGQALVLALDANAGETPDTVRAFAKKTGLTLPIFLNPDGRAADIFGTEVTTTTVVIDGAGVLRYRGRFREGDKHAYAEDALKALLAGKEVAVKTTPHDG